MIYSADISTPKDTLKTDPKQSVLTVTKGLGYRVEIQFPRGPQGLAGCAVYDGGHPVWPSTMGEWFRGNANTIAFDDTYLKLAAPYQFDIYTYNEDDHYPHSILFRIGFVSEEVFMARFLPSYSWKYFKKMLEEMKAEQEKKIMEALGKPLAWIE